jgi:drug/metabolite transporter (DMT)-like permease
MADSRSKSVLADFGLVYAAAVWGVTFVVVKDALEFIHPLTLVAWRFLLAAGVLAIALKLKGRPLLGDWRPGIILGIFLWVLYASQTIGLEITTASNSAFITGMFVAFVPIFEWGFTKRRPRTWKFLAVLLCLAGLWFLTGGIRSANAGDLLTLLTAAAYAAHIFIADRYMKGDHDPFVLSMQQFAVVGVLSLLAALLFGAPLIPTSSKPLAIIVFLALIPTLSAFVVQMAAQRRTAAIRVSLIFALEPVFAALVAWTYGGEQFIWTHALGGLLVVMALVTSGRQRPPVEAVPDS